MFRTLTIEGYRGIKKLTLDNLARVNLLVGQNNCGKTSVLEAIELVVSANPISTVLATARRRGDIGVVRALDGSEISSANAAGIFPRDAVRVDVTASAISFNGSGNDCRLQMSLVQGPSIKFEVWQFFGGIRFTQQPAWENRLRISDRGLAVEGSNHAGTGIRQVYPASAIFCGPTVPTVRALISQAKANGLSELLVAALKGVLPGISAVEILDRNDAERGMRVGVIARVDDRNLDFAQLGEGAWQCLAIAAGLVSSKGGLLLIDEFDTGIHYTKLAGVWKFIIETAEKLNVQVFATTHSKDCIEGLSEAAAAMENPSVSVQRISPGKETAVSYSQKEIVYAASHDVEMR